MSSLAHKTILIISPEPWTHIWVSKHHYARELARNNLVFFLNPPNESLSCEKSNYDNLNVVDYPGFPIGYRFLPKFIRSIIQNRVYQKIQKCCRAKFDIVWSFDNSVFFDLDVLEGHPFTISHCVDFSMDFQFSRATSTANICFSNTAVILAKQRKHTQKAFFINHGFAEVKPEPFNLPRAGSDTIKVGYAGNLDIPYLDTELLKETLKGHPDIDFYLAGHCHDPSKFHSRNSFYLGVLSKPNLSYFLREMDILIITYKADEYRNQLSNPHKLLEYMAAGKVIVATYTAEYKNSDLIFMSNKNSEWIELFNSVVRQMTNGKTVARSEAMIRFAIENSY